MLHAMLHRRRVWTEAEANALLGKGVRFVTRVRTQGGQAVSRGTRGRVTGVRVTPDSSFLVVEVRGGGTVCVGNAQALEFVED